MRSNGVSRNRGMSSIFLALNRNKRSLSIDLKTPAGLDALKQLLAGVDVLVHNMRVAAIERLGLGYAAVAALNPKIVYCVATGFGQDGPDANRPAFDDVIQAACGLASLIGHERDAPDFAPTLMADKTTGLAVVNAVLAALFHRERSGQGQYVEVPMLETMVAFTLAEHLGGLSFEPPTAKAGYARILAGGRKPAPTRDGHVAMLPYTAEHWHALFASIGRTDLANMSCVHQGDAMRHVHGLFLIMRHHNAGNAETFDNIDQFQLHVRAQLFVVRAHRFVQEQQFGTFGQ